MTTAGQRGSGTLEGSLRAKQEIIFEIFNFNFLTVKFRVLLVFGDILGRKFIKALYSCGKNDKALFRCYFCRFDWLALE